MQIEVSKTTLEGVLKIKRYRHDDHRGFYAEIYIAKDYYDAGITKRWPEDCCSFSKKGTLRGLHGDTKTWKLVSCLLGELYLVVLNNDATSDEFGKWDWFILTPENCLQILIPPFFANGHLVLSDGGGIFHYKQSEHYKGAENQFVVPWNDPRFQIQWPLKPGQIPLTSDRDRGV